jgi:hypothetical protein
MKILAGIVAVGFCGLLLLLGPGLLFLFFFAPKPSTSSSTACGSGAQPAAPVAHVTPPKGAAGTYGGSSLSGEQVGNAAAIYAQGMSMGVPAYGIKIALATAMGESTLRTLNYGDIAGPDSRGLFQQRANGAWGSLASRMSPAGSSSYFYRALLRVPGWSVMTVTAAAHAVQGNADPGFYVPYEPVGNALYASFTGSGPALAIPVTQPAVLSVPKCTTAPAVTVTSATLHNSAPGVSTASMTCPGGTSDQGTAMAPGNVSIRLCAVGGLTVNASLVGGLARLLAAASADGVHLGGGGFRSNSEQIKLRSVNGCPDLTSSASTCAVPTAPPGKSMHEWGLAIDFAVGGQTIGRGSPAKAWLDAHSASFGLHPLSSEAWHFSVNGK